MATFKHHMPGEQPYFANDTNWNKPCWRKEVEDGHSKIAYGHDRVSGYFIDVHDLRLDVGSKAFTEESKREPLSLALDDDSGEEDDDPDDVKEHSFGAVCHAVGRSGEGIYLRVHTGSTGCGKRVSDKTMLKIWRLYGVVTEDLDKIK